MKLAKLGGATQVLESRVIFALVIGAPTGMGIYFLVTLATRSFSVLQLILAGGVGFGFAYLVKAGYEKVTDVVTDKLMGLKREFTPEEQARREYDELIAACDNRGDDAEAVRQRKAYLESGAAAHPNKLAFQIACLYDEKLHEPQEAVYWYRKTLSYGEEKNDYCNAAREALDRLLNQGDVSEEDFQNRVEALKQALTENNEEAAEGLIADLRRLYPERDAPCLLAGVLASRREHHALAVAYYQLALERNPQNVKAAFNLAVAFGKSRQWGEARAAWRDFLERFGERHPQEADQARRALAAVEREVVIEGGE